jgi:hypothetical protein
MRASLQKLAAASVLLMACLALCACGDDSSTGADPGDGSGEVDPQAVALAALLTQSMQEAFFFSLVADPTTIDGAGGGTLMIAGDLWTFAQYSPDGEISIDGSLTVRKSMFPNIPAAGELTLSGSYVGNLIVDIMVVAQGTQLAPTGTIQLGDEVWDMEDLAAAAADE